MEKKLLRSLDNYKEQHQERAKKLGVELELLRCTTLTAARALLFGNKSKKKKR